MKKPYLEFNQERGRVYIVNSALPYKNYRPKPGWTTEAHVFNFEKDLIELLLQSVLSANAQKSEFLIPG